VFGLRWQRRRRHLRPKRIPICGVQDGDHGPDVSGVETGMGLADEGLLHRDAPVHTATNAARLEEANQIVCT
jgi:hypothetical protein